MKLTVEVEVDNTDLAAVSYVLGVSDEGAEIAIVERMKQCAHDMIGNARGMHSFGMQFKEAHRGA